MNPLAARHPALPLPASAVPFASPPVHSSRDDRFLTLIERRTALGMFAIAAIALLLVWVSETALGVIEPHDRWAEPLLALLMAVLFVVLLRHPASLLAVQRCGVLGVGSYFLVSTVAVLIVGDRPASPYWIATLFQWMPPLYLLLFATWPTRWALTISLTLFTGVAIPCGVAALLQPDVGWREAIWPVLINGVISQTFFLAGMMGLSRLRRGLAVLTPSQASHSPQDAAQAIEAWVATRTAELARAKDSAEAASRAKSRFLAVMSHELRTPLHAVLASAELLGDDRALRSDAREAALIDTIRRSGAHLLTLIDQVLELSRIEAGKLDLADQPVDLREIAERALQAVRQQAEAKRLELTCDIHPALPLHRRGDALRLAQILINLMANAVKFTEQGRVRLRVLPIEGAEGVRFIVDDTGPGLTQQEQARVFDAFHQVDAQSTRQHGGAGLGLTITRELVTLMRGEVRLSSRPGIGTQVEILLPLPVAAMAPAAPTTPAASQTASPASRPAALHEAPSLSGLRVLVVEDDPVNSMLAIEMLAGAGAEVLTAESGPAALALLRTETVHVVLMDWRMPGMDGLEATRRIRRGEAGTASMHLAVLGLTANAFAEDRQSCLDAGMDHVLTKPIERLKLLQDVRSWADAQASREHGGA